MSDTQSILIIDDEVELAEALSDKLSTEGYETMMAHDGAEGLALALAKHPDLILLDVMMPVLDGWGMLEKLKEDGWGKSANVIMLTNQDSMDDIARAVEQEAYKYIVKANWELDDIVKQVKEQIG